MRKVFLAAAAMVALAVPSHALTMLRLDVDQLARYSSAVVVAEVQSIEVIADEPGVPLTKVTVDVAESLKGDLTGETVLLSPGLPGAPDFAAGETLVLFIHSADGVHVLTGFQQGHFRVLADGETLDRAVPGLGRSADATSLQALTAAVEAALAGGGE